MEEETLVEEKKFQLKRWMLIVGILAIIAIIAIIFVIVGMVNKNKEKYTIDDFKKLENRMVEETPNYLIQKNVTLTGEEYRIDLKDLLEENGGAIDPNKVKAAKICEGYVIAVKTDTEKYTAYISCGKHYTTTGYVSNDKTTTKKTTTVKDKKKPVITLVGDKEVTIELNGVYEEKGAKATDNVDGDLTSSIKISGNVNVKKEGQYKITYTVTDKAGNRAEETRIVNVKKPNTTSTTTTTKRGGSVNTTKPTTKNTTKRPTTSARPTTPPTIVLNGSRTVTINVGTNYVDPGYSARDCLGKDITSKVVVTGNLKVNQPGTYLLTYSVTDDYGNRYSTTRTVIVKSTYIPVSNISLSPNSFSLSVGQSKTISVYISPSNATNKSVSWSSSNPSVASVSGGKVTAISKGSTTITVRGADGKSASARVTVR